ncbi:transferrin receptor-like dimerization domain-containing protein [Pollutibacter soli]|uniref:transferrin receptor-like dimerization domain-containing protein n=1 Tax=Pollutibacter soli TaxID=3034157 RepID=UPI003013E32B
MRKLILLSAFSLSGLAPASVSAQEKISGFNPTSASTEIKLEKAMDSLISPKDQQVWMEFLSSRPHHLGSSQDKINADYMAKLFREWGYDTELSSYQVLFPTPKTRLLELLGTKKFTAKLEESTLKEDRTSGQKSEQLPTYNAYSADGDVTAELVFVNRGVPADYEVLRKAGISVKGKIVIAKYGGSWRGIKPKLAAFHGAIGCLIYSDPLDDGYGAGDAYPKGPYRPGDGAQRGSVMDMPVTPGDPTTPGFASTPDAKRLSVAESPTIMKIPVLPISWEDAKPLLESLQGPVAPDEWRGGLPITYHMGPSVAKVHLKLAFNWDLKPVYNVIATLKGSELPDEWIIRGNHHDAWVNGAADPLSGMVAVMSEAKAIGILAKQGFKPKRTIIFCGWDGEEQALLGSTEWVEDHASELQKKAVAYINSDGNSRGFIHGGGSHAFEPFFNEIISVVKDPQTGVSIRDRRYAVEMVLGDRAKRTRIMGNKTIKLSALGAGSDYSPFFQHLGIPSFNIGFGGEGSGGEYHSIYDSYDHFVRFKDPGFAYGAALASTAGRMVLRLANADIIPADFTTLYSTINGYVGEVKTLADNIRIDAEHDIAMAAEKLYDLARDPKEPYVAAEVSAKVPFFNFSRLDNAMVQFKTAADSYKKLSAKAEQLPEAKRNELNNILFQAEKSLLLDKGLPRRPWYRHLIYAPGYFTGYGVKTLPGVREAIEEKNWAEAQEQIGLLSGVIEAFTAEIEKANAVLK